ncbi:MAG: preprotein translocase subunit SecY [Candidatus Parcubacteria bacterium]|nr:MAG: preprotein translocase subunit SecY [Candidatus Parcubacteria bacterium]
MRIINAFKNLFKYSDLRKRFFWVIALLLFFRVLANIPLPDVDLNRFKNLFESNQFLGFINIFSGGALSRFSIALLGLGPYITAIIILQLLTFVYPRLKEMYYEEGDVGRAKFNQYARILTLPLSFIQSFGFLNFLQSQQIIQLTPFFMFRDAIIISTSVIILMWLGELITEQKLGNGISLIIFSGIVAGAPSVVYQALATFTVEKLQIYIPFIILAIAIVAGIVFINEAERRIQLVFAKRVRGMKLYGGANTYLPVRIAQAGVIPIIFAIAVLLFPQTLIQFLALTKITFFENLLTTVNSFLNNQFLFAFLYFLFVFVFTYLYTSITFNPEEISKNLQSAGAFVPGLRPGKETEKYFKNIVSRLTFFGGIFLGIIAILPYLFQFLTKTNFLAIGGTSILIVVSVAIETVKQIESELSLRRYET